ncbi:hypothetical protein ACLOJK_023450 [Asimina triloba]
MMCNDVYDPHKNNIDIHPEDSLVWEKWCSLRPLLEKQSSGITSVLASAAFEWLSIFMLFLEAFFSFLVTRFARFYELQTPCLLCSRLDHIFGIEKPGFYWDLICHEHKLEISSLVYCYTHGKLNDIRGMCKGCVSSFSAKKVADFETDKFAVGFIEYSVDDEHNICLLELIVPEEPRSSSNAGKHPVEISEEMDVIKPVDISTESDLKPEMILNEAVSSVSDCLDLNAAYKLAIANEGNHLLIMSKDIAGGHDDLKLLLSQISAARGFELSWNDVIPSPRVLQPVEGALLDQLYESGGTLSTVDGNLLIGQWCSDLDRMLGREIYIAKQLEWEEKQEMRWGHGTELEG